MSDTLVFGQSKAELGAMLDSISQHTDMNHLSDADNHNSMAFLESGMQKLSESSGAKETFGVKL